MQAMQRMVDNLIAVIKESVNIFTYESLNNIVRFINGLSALLLVILPGKTNILEGLQGWELKPTFRGPRLPRWMGNGVSSFNRLIHELSMDSDTSSIDFSSGEEDSDGYLSAESTKYENSRFSFASSMNEYERPWTSIGKLQSLRDHFVQRATDRGRGVIEDLHLATEIIIETIFDAVHKTAHFLLSPSKAFGVLFPWAFEYDGDPRRDNNGHSDDYVETTVQTTTLGEGEPFPNERKTTLHPLNTDARTCQDVITELGYPYEAIRVITDDGYILLLERIPRRDSRQAVYLQHGVLDSSMGWVSNGVVGSPAFAAFDQGYDVFLGNFRGLVSREHVDRSISSKQYWRYSINEHGTMDISAIIEKIHEVKTTELKLRYPDLDLDEQAYNLCAICHSLAGGAILIYLITRRLQQKSHRLSRLILLSPAGFHDDSTFAFTIVGYMLLALAPIMVKFVPAFYIPTRFFRMLLNKLSRDFHNYPAIGGVVQTLVSYLAGGDSSNWIGVLGLPHYNMNDMPGVSFYVALHLTQMKMTGKFRMFDYGNSDTNMKVYGCPEPLDLGKCYDLIDIPVDLVGGRKDKVIRPTMVWKHYCMMTEAGVEASYNEYEYAHLDFTISHREELLAYVMSRLSVAKSTQKRQSGR